MAEITLKADVGRPTGTRVSKRLRATGRVPGVVYGLGNDPVPVAVEWRDLRHALTTDAGLNALIDLEFDGQSQLSIVKALQRHPVHHTVTHVDFLLIRRDVAITVDVPLVLEGEAEEALKEGAVVDQMLTALSVSAKPADIPNELAVDVSSLAVGDTIRVGDLALPSGVTTEVDPEDPIVTAHIVVVDVPEPEAEGEGEEGEEGEAAEGEAAEGGEGATAEGGDGGDAGSAEGGDEG